MGFDMKEGKLVRWLKKEGEEVGRGEPLLEIETDKAVVEVEAFASGVLRRILVGEGETVPVGHIIGIIAAPQETLPELPPTARPLAPEAPPPPVREAAPARPPSERLRVSPLARRIAEEKGIDLSLVKGSGPGGRILEQDVQAYLAAREAPPTPEKITPAPTAPTLSPMRQAIARRMSQSKREAPHFYLITEVDMTAAMKLREELNQTLEGEARITVNDMVVKAAANALKKFPQINASYLEDRLQANEKINIGVAVALEEGLVAPALLDCGNKSLAEIARASKDLVERARAGVLKQEEYTGATFTVSNLGMFDVDAFIAIINPPQSAILAVGTARSQPVVRGDQIVIAQQMKLTLSADHRVTDGAQAAQFLAEVKRLLQNPLSLLL